MSPRKVSRRSLSVLIALGVVLTSCSGDSDSDGDTTVAGSVEETTAPDTAPDDTEAPDDTALSGEGLAIGVVAPSQGLLTSLFQGQTRGIDFAVADIAEGGGVLDGPLDVTTEQTPLNEVDADVVPALVEGGAQALIGPAGSDGGTEYRDALAEADSISCSASATLPGLTYGQESFGLFRTALPDDVLVSYLADMIVARRDTEAPGAAWNVAIVARSDDYGLAVGNGLAVSLESRGLGSDVVAYNPRRVLFTGEAGQVTSLDPDLTVIVSYEEGAAIVTELVRGGVDPTTMIGLESFMQPNIATTSAPDGDVDLVDGFTVLGATGDRAFFQRLLDDNPTGQMANAAQAYDCAIVLALATGAVDDGSSDSMSDAVRDVTGGGTPCTTYDDCLTKLNAGEDIDYDGASGRIAIDENGDPSFGRFTSATLEAGEFANITTSDVDLAEIRREQAAFAAASFNTKLQQALTFLGFYSGPIDGLDSPELTAALAAFQLSVGLPPTGVYDAATDAALRAALGSYSDLLNSSTLELQILLTELGYYNGPLDGIWSPEVTAAIRALQRDLGVPETGVMDAATIRAVYAAGINTGATTTTTTAPATTAAPETTAVPETTAAPTTVPPTAPPTTIPPPPEESDLYDTLVAEGNFTVFLGLLDTAGYTNDVESLDAYTVFAPTDEAFAAADETLVGQIDQLAGEALVDYLANYLVSGRITTDQMPPPDGQLIPIHGDPLVITGTAPAFAVDGMLISASQRDILATNGVIQALDGVFPIPPAAGDTDPEAEEDVPATDVPVDDEPVATEPEASDA